MGLNLNSRKSPTLRNKGAVQRSVKSSKFELNPELGQKLNQALAYHRENKLALARSLYESILKAQPEHFDTLQLYATLLAQSGDLVLALEYLLCAARVAPAQAVEPSKLVGVYNNLGNIYKGLDKLDLALSSYGKASELNPVYADAHNNKGLVLLEQCKYLEALSCFNETLRLNPSFIQALNNKGNALRALGHYPEALSSFDQALSLNPDYAQAHSNKGLVLQDMHNLEAALNAYQFAIKLRPNYAEALYNCANVYKELDQFQLAEDYYQAAIEAREDYAQAFNNLGSVYKLQRKFDEALESYSRALQINPSFALALYNRGNLFKDLNNSSAALADFARAVKVDASFAEAQLNISMVYLALGDFQRGWAGFEWRLKSKVLLPTVGIRSFDQPTWLGHQSLTNKTILLYAEQGLGDTLQFCRYATLTKERGARVILEVPVELFTLLENLQGVDVLLRKGDALPHFDYQCPLMSLPFAFNTELQNIPGGSAYIQCDPIKAKFWHSKIDLRESNKPKVGLVWSGNSNHLNDSNRSISLSLLRDLLTLDCQFFSLQKELSSPDKLALGKSSELEDMSSFLQDFGDTAALVSNLDLVIAVDTSVAHLAGAMDKPVWLLLPFNSDWRWLQGVSTSPWYPSMKLYRQKVPGDWQNVLVNVKSDLSKLFGL